MKSIFNKMVDSCNILAGDATTVVLTNVAAGLEELSGRALELAQLHSSEVTVCVTVRWNAAIISSCYVQFGGGLYPVDYVQDPGLSNPDASKGQVRRGIVMELYAHRIQDGGFFSDGFALENGLDAFLLEDGANFLQLET